jgi:hypothetical protein
MAADAYAGHASWSASKAAGTNAANVAPADAPSQDFSSFTTDSGVAARRAGYPRSDGQSNPGVR